MFVLLSVLIATTVSSKVDSVVVYPDQVLVVRTASVSLQGSGTLEFPDLPGGLDDNTVRLKAPGLEIGEVQVKPGYMPEPTPLVKSLNQKVKDLEDKLQGIDDQAEILKAKEAFLASIKLGAPELIAKDLQQGRVSPESWKGALAFMAAGLAETRAQSLVLKRQREKLDEELTAARKEYNAARAAVENRKTVRVEYSGDAGTFDVRLAYVIRNGASWSPYYELRARPDKDKVGLEYYCRLAQSTGEDWERVAVVLSTSRPVLGLAAPTPYPWYLSLYSVEEGWDGGRSMERSVMSREVDLLAPQAVAYDQVQAVETGISLQYVIPTRVSLASGEPAKKLLLRESELSSQYGYYTLPRAQAQVFLTGRLVNTTPFVLLAGSANTYVGDEYTGSTWLPTVAPGETTEVSFGVDERVKVTRELVKSFRSKSGLFSKNVTDRLVYRTVVENYHPKAVDIQIVEQVPVSQQKEISVKVDKVGPQGYEYNKDTGTYTWKTKLEPRARFDVEVDFTVSHPPVVSGHPMELRGLF